MALAFLTAGAVTHWRLRAMGEDPEIVYSLLIGAIVGGIVGAKLHYLILHPDEFRVALFSGSGLVWYGGLLGGFVGVYLVAHFMHAPQGGAGRRHRPGVGARLLGGTASAASSTATTTVIRPHCPGVSRSPRARRPPPSASTRPNSTRCFASARHLRAAGLGDQSPHAPGRGPHVGVHDPGRHRTVPGGVRAHEQARAARSHPAAVDQHRAGRRRRDRCLVDAVQGERRRRGTGAGPAASARGRQTASEEDEPGSGSSGKAESLPMNLGTREGLQMTQHDRSAAQTAAARPDRGPR